MVWIYKEKIITSQWESTRGVWRDRDVCTYCGCFIRIRWSLIIRGTWIWTMRRDCDDTACLEESLLFGFLTGLSSLSDAQPVCLSLPRLPATAAPPGLSGSLLLALFFHSSSRSRSLRGCLFPRLVHSYLNLVSISDLWWLASRTGKVICSKPINRWTNTAMVTCLA